MSNAVYILSSLPMLRFGDVPRFRSPRSATAARVCLLRMSSMRSTLSSRVRESEDPFVSAYQARETQMKNVAGRLRASAWGPDVRFLRTDVQR